MSAYYNEFHPFAAEWLRNLINAGLIADGDVDERSIVDVSADDLVGYTQCHFFAGIGGWSYALRLAGWPDDRPVWTGSCPCQPFSTAGRRKGKSDERHLWPVWDRLIEKCRPTVIFGEQVAAAVTQGWLDDVYQGLEDKDYAIGSAVLPACSISKPHRRDRLWFVANREMCGRNDTCSADRFQTTYEDRTERETGRCSSISDVAYSRSDQQYGLSDVRWEEISEAGGHSCYGQLRVRENFEQQIRRDYWIVERSARRDRTTGTGLV
jgi:DNA (cytosine-5)-methyltransferase 1